MLPWPCRRSLRGARCFDRHSGLRLRLLRLRGVHHVGARLPSARSRAPVPEIGRLLVRLVSSCLSGSAIHCLEIRRDAACCAVRARVLRHVGVGGAFVALHRETIACVEISPVFVAAVGTETRGYGSETMSQAIRHLSAQMASRLLSSTSLADAQINRKI